MRKKLLSHFALLLLLLFSNSSGNSASRAGQGAEGVFNLGPDIIAGNMADLEQFGAVGTQRGLATAITSCNAGNEFVGFFAMPNTDHPAVAQNLYRMSGGSGNNDRFEQIGQSWVKHTYGAKQANDCNFGCLPGGNFTHLGVGCSDTYFNFQSAEQGDLGSRAWINPFTGVFSTNARNHTGHNHTAVSHMMVVESDDLNQTINASATYYAELVYVTPNEYTWCQAHPGECNMYNNASYLQFSVAGTTDFSFSQVGSPVRMTPAINAWSGATIQTIEPEPGGDGRAYLAYKVTGPVAGLYHYEYAIYNQSLDRGIQSFSVPRLLLPGAELSELNVEFHGPPQHPGFPADGTQGDAGFSSAEWTFKPSGLSLTWTSETFAQNQNANAIRWGTLYNFRFDSTTEPAASNATIGFFKTGAPITVAILGPAPIGGPSPTPVQTATPTPTPPLTVSLPNDTLDNSLPIDTVFIEPVVTTNIDAGLAYVGFQGDFTFDETVVTFAAPFVEAGGLTANNWNVVANILTGTGPIRTLRVSAFSNDFTPLSGSGLLYNLRMVRVTKQASASTPLTWAVAPDNFNYIDTKLDLHAPGQDNGLITIAEPTPTPTPTPTSTPSPTATPVGAAQVLNLSTRLLTQGASYDVGIGGFIITGTAPKQVLLRGIGPSLADFGVPNALADPLLELHGPGPFNTIINNNWKDTQQALIEATGLQPTNDLESALLVTLDPGAYTAVVRGHWYTDAAGVALVEVYDLDQAVASKLANIATRAFVYTGNDIVIAGFILGNNTNNDKIVVRGIGPSLTAFGVSSALADPTLELRDSSGTLLMSNDNWQDNPAQATELTKLNLAPTNALESGIVSTLAPGAYTALLAGVDNGIGNALVEIYDNPIVGPPMTPPPTPTPTSTPSPPPTPVPAPQTLALPIVNLDTSVPIAAVIVQPVTTTKIGSEEGYTFFGGKFTFDERVCTFAHPPVQKAGLTSGSDWVLRFFSRVLPGPGPIRTLEVWAYSNDSTPLSGSGTLFNLNMIRVGSAPGASAPLVWGPLQSKNYFYFGGDQGYGTPTQPDGLVTIATTIPTPTPIPAPQTVGLPIANVPISISAGPVPLTTTNINASEAYVGFQGDFTFDETVCAFSEIQSVTTAGLTGGSGSWNVSGSILPGPGPIKTLRVTAFSADFIPLSGSGTLLNLRVQRVSSIVGASTPLVWQPAPENFYFIDENLDLHLPTQTNGLLTITGPVSTPIPALQTVSLPIANLNTSVPIGTVVVQPLTTTNINAIEAYIGFQGNFTFDETVFTFANPPVENAGLTGGNGNWYVSGNVLPGPGPMRTIRLYVFSEDSTPLSGSGTLCNLNLLRVSSTPGASTSLLWQPAPDNFYFFNSFTPAEPTQTNGVITITTP